jgi:DNA-binding beta-propeller fold protein YncE
VATGGYYNGLAVDEDFNVYTSDGNRQLLQKWLPDATQPINLLDGFSFTALFFHSPTRSFYFIDMFHNFYRGVYKLALGSITPMIVVFSNGTGSSLNQLQSNCRGLYVNKLGDIFVLDSDNQRVLKWTVNASSGILVAGGGGKGNGSTQLSDPHGLYVDELNSAIYVADTRNNRIQKYIDGSVSGVTVIDLVPANTVASSMYDPGAIFVDRTGSILVSEFGHITKWTPGAKDSIKVATGYQGSGDNLKYMMAASAFAFDNLGNLYVLDWTNQRVLKFNSTSSSCTTKIL